MPLIQVQVIKDVFSQEQKRQIISKLTDAMVSIEGENMRQVTLCLVEEVESGDWGIGGKALTTADVQGQPEIGVYLVESFTFPFSVTIRVSAQITSETTP